MRASIALIEEYSFTQESASLGVSGLAESARLMESLGFDEILSSETAGHDPFFPLLIAAEHTHRVDLVTGIAVAFPRSPMVTAQMAWDLQRLSGGRFQLGLGAQVKGHNERRYGVPWTGPPGPRMREYVLCLQAIFETFQNPDSPRFFEGEHFRFSMAPEVFMAKPIDHPRIPINVAALNPYMCRLGGELCDGVFAHPVCTPRYVEEIMLPAIEEGALKSGRSLGEINVIGSPIIVTGRNQQELDEELRLLKRRVAFYGSTRTYHPVLEVHGWRAVGEELHALSLENRWKEMTDLIPDEMAAEFGIVGRVDEIGSMLAERWGGILSTINFPTDFPRQSEEDQACVEAILATVHGVGSSGA